MSMERVVLRLHGGGRWSTTLPCRTPLLRQTTPLSWLRRGLAGPTPSPTSPCTPAAGTSATSITGLYGSHITRIIISRFYKIARTCLILLIFCATPPFHMQSVTFTAVPLFLVSMLWLMGFGVVLLVISCCCCFCRNKDNTYSPGCYVSSLVLLVTLTLATM
jgi:hypothetical protein